MLQIQEEYAFNYWLPLDALQDNISDLITHAIKFLNSVKFGIPKEDTVSHAKEIIIYYKLQILASLQLNVLLEEDII